MRAPRLIQLMASNSVVMSEELIKKIRELDKCKDLLLRVPDSEQRQYAVGIYSDLTKWLADEREAVIEEHYVELGIHRSGQGVPLSQMFWAVSTARESLSEYVQQECLHEDPVEFVGGVMMLRSLNTFFDRVLYFAILGYERASHDNSVAMSFLSQRRSA
jgi:hypothetical protein